MTPPESERPGSPGSRSEASPSGDSINQLIEEGLTLYGQGDLDGALLAWEKALGADPENAQATSYVDYVRQNYDTLTGEAQSTEHDAPFGIDDDPYQIEILPGEWERLSAPSIKPPPASGNDVDEGWFMDDDESARRAAPDLALELDAEEPPAVSFEDETREYQNAHRPPARAITNDSGRNEFGSENTPAPVSGFHSQPTNLVERETGFVKPTARGKQTSMPPEAFSTMSMPKLDNLPPEPALATASISLSYDEPGAAIPTRPPTAERKLSPEAEELINSLPSPTPRESVETITPLLGSPPLDPTTGKPRTGTAELPQSLRLPAITEAPPPIAMGASMTRDVRTRDFDAQPTKPSLPKPSATPTRELKPSELSSFGNMVSAPTRDLGIRPLGVTGTATATPLPDDEKTSQRRPIVPVGEGTRADVILPFDPIDARSAQILDEVDEGAEPVGESREDKTRRRITTLFERALAWSQSGELDKAVAAIDLALSEDPNSALGQKLVHRHREQMLAVFQAFLGDLDRQPVLARPLHELASAPISPRAAFLLSRIDGSLSLDELLDVSGMPRIEAYRYLCQLFLRGILR